ETGERIGDDAQPDRRAEVTGRLGAKQLAQRQALDVLHRQEVRAAVLADLVAVHEVGMVEPQREARLGEKSAPRRVAGRGPRALDHDQLVDAEEAARDRQVDVRLAAAAQLGDQPVAPDHVTGERRSEAWLGAGSGWHVAEPPWASQKRYR